MYDIYGHLRRRVGGRAAGVLCAVWYAGLIMLVIYYSFEPQAEFNYLNF